MTSTTTTHPLLLPDPTPAPSSSSTNLGSGGKIDWNDKQLLEERFLDFEMRLLAVANNENLLKQLMGRVELLEGKLNMIRHDVDLITSLTNVNTVGGGEVRVGGGGIDDYNNPLLHDHPNNGYLARFGQPTSTPSASAAPSVWGPQSGGKVEPTLITIKQEPGFYDEEEVEEPTFEHDDDNDYDADPAAGDIGLGAEKNTRRRRSSLNNAKSKSKPIKKWTRIINSSDNDSDNNDEDHDQEQEDLSPYIVAPPASRTIRQTHAPDQTIIELVRTKLASIERTPDTAKFPCPECTKAFNHKKDLVRHFYSHSGMKPYKCALCSAAFARGDKLTGHLRAMHPNAAALPMPNPKTSQEGEGPVKFNCTKCTDTAGVWFPSVKKLSQHYAKVHTGSSGDKKAEKLPHFCPDCGKPFPTSYKLNRHVAIHSKERKFYPCQVCKKNYTRIDKMRAHQRKEHVPNTLEVADVDLDATKRPKTDAATHTCTICSKSFSQKSRLERHTIACSGLKPFSCEDCGMSFTQKSSVMQHRACVHQKIKRFLCADCGKPFYGSTNYKKHVRSHTGVKPYVCKICGRAFNGSGDLRSHERIHAGDKKISCSLCELKFYRPYALKRHMMVHTGERPYMCDLCGSSFSQGGTLKKHKECHARGSLNLNKNRGGGGGGGRVERKPRESRLQMQMMAMGQGLQEQEQGQESGSSTSSRVIQFNSPQQQQQQQQLMYQQQAQQHHDVNNLNLTPGAINFLHRFSSFQ